METVISVIVILVGIICWVGQTLSFVAPEIAVKLSLCEPEKEMDQTLYIIETKAHGLTDMLLSWILPISGLLMILKHPLWPIFSLVGGGIYINFSSVFILHRVFLKRQNIKIGRPESEKVAYIFGAVWIISSIIMIVMATTKLGL